MILFKFKRFFNVRLPGGRVVDIKGVIRGKDFSSAAPADVFEPNGSMVSVFSDLNDEEADAVDSLVSRLFRDDYYESMADVPDRDR